MKKIIIFIVFCFGCTSIFSQTKNKKNVDDIFLQIPYSDYVGKEVFNLLLNDNIKCYQDFVFFDERPGVLTGAMIKINHNIYLKIYISDFKYIVPFDENRKWDRQLFYKETIGRIKVYQNKVCAIDTDDTNN